MYIYAPIRPSCIWEDNIKMDFQAVGLVGGMDWIGLVQNRDRMVGTFECGNEPSSSIESRELLD
jgi:hypothetical protein